MLGTISNNLFITVPLIREAYKWAAKLQGDHQHKGKERQIYLNTLAVDTVAYYCKLQDIKTDTNASDSFDTLRQLFHNNADLYLPEFGTVFCIPYIPGETSEIIYPETEEKHLGYIVVEINEQEKSARLSGFIRYKKHCNKINLITDRKPFDTFLDALYAPKWNPIETFYKVQNSITKYGFDFWSNVSVSVSVQKFRANNPQQNFALAGGNIHNTQQPVFLDGGENIKDTVDIWKDITLDNFSQPLVLRLRLKESQNDPEKILFSISLHNLGDIPLPEGLKLSLLDEEKNEDFVKINQNQNLKSLYLSDNFLQGEKDERFIIQIQLEQEIVEEYFELA